VGDRYQDRLADWPSVAKNINVMSCARLRPEKGRTEEFQHQE
jgi:hypothetical protein